MIVKTVPMIVAHSKNMFSHDEAHYILLSLGMNTSADWERFLQKGKDSYGYSSNRCRNSIDSLRKHGETINERGYMADDLLPRQSAVPFYHQEYISYHCADLISELLQMKQGRWI